MKKGKGKFIALLLLTGLLILTGAGVDSAVYAQEESFFLPELEPALSEDGLTLYNGIPPLLVVVDPNPGMQGIQAPGPSAADLLAAPEATASTFSINYIAAGDKDLWGRTCIAFPASAMTAFNAAAAIWANTLKSTVPVTINACWSDLSSPTTLGYSGGQPLHRDMGFPKENTWYTSSLANSIAGHDIDSGSVDMNITCNSGVTWYYGADGNPPVGQFDLVTVAARQIGHGLNFSGAASYFSGEESNGILVYAIAPGSSNHSPEPVTAGLLEEQGWQITANAAIPTPQLPSGDITDTTPTYKWTKLNRATQYRLQLMQGSTVIYAKIVAPTACAASCKYTPSKTLDYKTYQWQVQAMVDGGWDAYSALKTFTVHAPPTPQDPSGAITDTTPTFKWSKVAGATQYRFKLTEGATTVYIKTVASSACGTSTCTSTPEAVLGFSSYKWKVKAMAGGAWGPYSSGKTFTISDPSLPKAGFWQGNGMEFYVTTDQAKVDKFAIIVDFPCGRYKVLWNGTHVISNRQFSFTGPFYASGTFDTATTAHGTTGLKSYPICGTYLDGGPWNWTATWKNTNQPIAIVVDGTATSVIAEPSSNGANSFTVSPD